MKDINKVKDKLILIAALFCVVFVGASAVFLRYSKRQNILEIRSYMTEVAQQSKQAIRKQITGDFETLNGIAQMVGSMEEIDYEALMPVLQSINEQNTFIRMGFSDRGGRTMGVDIDGTLYHDVDLSKKGFVERAYAGETVITVTQKAEVGDFFVNFYAVPVIHDGEVVSVLCAVDRADTLREILDTSVFAGKGFAHIVDREGNYVLRSIHPSVSSDSLSIYDYHELSEKNVRRLKKDLSEQKSGSLAYPYNKQNHWAAYTPIGINDWYVFCVVPENQIDSNYIRMSVGIIGIVAGACLIFLFFLIYIKRMNDRRRRELEDIAFVDPLTGCRNEQKFLRDAAHILKSETNKKYAVFYADIKNFKYVNDVFGYDVGDDLLKYWAGVLQELMKDGEIFARISVDHFASLQTYHTTDELEMLFRKAQKRLGEYPAIKARKFNLELYLGIYLIDGSEAGLSVRDMLNRANVAERSAKDSGKSSFAYYNEEMRHEYLQEIEMGSRMETALQNKEFKLYLQPKIDILHHDRIFGAEALVRWCSPDKGLIPPSEFIPLFERNGFIVLLDRYMLEEVCRYYQQFDGEEKDTMIFSVNVSRKGLWQPDFVEYYTRVKERFGVPDGRIELEFTESFVFEDNELFIETVKQLHQNGFLCSLDDFGAGQSSLNILKNIPVDILKLDMLFFREGQDKERDRMLVNSIINMAKALSMQTVAEGVESAWQVEALRDMGCNLIQGYIFSKPLPKEEFTKFIKRWRQEHA